jgi:AraC-like DNA-binding protein
MEATMSEPRETSIAATHAQQLVALVGRWGVTPARLFAGTGLDEALIADPKARVAIPVVAKLADRAKELTGEPGLGFYLGLSMRASSHGYLGFAAMASATLGEALDLVTRFTPTRTDALAIRKHVSGSVASVVIEELGPLGAATDVLILSLLVGMQVVAEAITGERMQGGADVALPEPPYIARFRHVCRGGVRFGQPAHQLVFDAAALNLPLVMADKAALALASEQCERELSALGYDTLASRRLRAMMTQTDPGFPSLDEAAKAFGFSVRTLKRRLDDEGESFSSILDEQRRERALLLLRSTGLSIEAVSDRVGYSDIANFTRAFRRWTETTPTAFRRAGKR